MIGSITSRFIGLWLLIGNFNSLIHSSERVGGRVVDNMADIVLNALDDIGVIKLQASGRVFSWNNRREVGRIHSKIDRAFAKSDWWAVFPNAYRSYFSTRSLHS